MQEFLLIAQIKVSNQKSSNRRGVVSVAQVIQSGFLIVDITAIAERIALAQRRCQRAGRSERIARCAVLVFYNERARIVNQPDDVSLKIVEVGVDRAIESYLRRTGLRVVEEVKLILLCNLIPDTFFVRLRKCLQQKSPPLVCDGTATRYLSSD